MADKNQRNNDLNDDVNQDIATDESQSGRLGGEKSKRDNSDVSQEDSYRNEDMTE